MRAGVERGDLGRPSCLVYYALQHYTDRLGQFPQNVAI